MLQEALRILRGERGDADMLLTIVVLVLGALAFIFACAVCPVPPQ